jgi:hypothetical protein
MSELLRIEQGCDQVAKQEHSDDDDCECGDAHGLPQLLAGCDIQQRDSEEANGEDDHQKVAHARNSVKRRRRKGALREP